MTDMSNSLVPTMKLEKEDVLTQGMSSSSSELAPEQSLDVLASMHYTYAPMLRKSLPKLSKKELYRIVNTIIEIPPDQKTIGKFNQAQKNVYFTMEKVLMSKYFMMYNVALENEMNKLKEEKINVLEEKL